MKHAFPKREVHYEHSVDLADLLAKLKTTLLISTYQAGKLAVVGSLRGQVRLSLHNFDRPMGVSVDPRGQTMAVATRDKVWHLKNAREIAPQVEPIGTHDACFLTRTAHVTGEISSHEMGWANKISGLSTHSFPAFVRSTADLALCLAGNRSLSAVSPQKIVVISTAWQWMATDRDM